jgi:hypothetical protein
MRPESLRDAIKAVPFRPFSLVTADGSRIEVKHPEWIAYPGGRVAVVIDPDDRTYYLEVARVTRLDLAPPILAGSPAPDPNGGE